MSGRILIADDEPDLREPLAYALRQQGFEVGFAADGDAALEQARTGDYDLLVCDVLMPGLLGTDVCRILRAESDLPIILLTAKDAEIDRVLGLELGADDYVTKPFSSPELVSRIRALLRRRELDLEAATGSATQRSAACRSTSRDTRSRSTAPSSAHTLRVPRSHPPCRATRARVQPRPDHAAPLANRLRRRRTRLRRPHLQPSPQDRARPEQPRADRHRPRSRLQARASVSTTRKPRAGMSVQSAIAGRRGRRRGHRTAQVDCMVSRSSNPL